MSRNSNFKVRQHNSNCSSVYIMLYKLAQLIVNHTQWNTSYCYLLKITVSTELHVSAHERHHQALTPSLNTTLRPPQGSPLPATLHSDFRTAHHNTSDQGEFLVFSSDPSHSRTHYSTWTGTKIPTIDQVSTQIYIFPNLNTPLPPTLLYYLIFHPHRHCFIGPPLLPPRPVTKVDLHDQNASNIRLNSLYIYVPNFGSYTRSRCIVQLAVVHSSS